MYPDLHSSKWDIFLVTVWSYECGHIFDGHILTVRSFLGLETDDFYTFCFHMEVEELTHAANEKLRVLANRSRETGMGVGSKGIPSDTKPSCHLKGKAPTVVTFCIWKGEISGPPWLLSGFDKVGSLAYRGYFLDLIRLDLLPTWVSFWIWDGEISGLPWLLSGFDKVGSLAYRGNFLDLIRWDLWPTMVTFWIW